jgi:hypothetical protein
MATQEPKAAEAFAADPGYIIDDGPLTEEDLEAIRAFEANPETVSTDVILADLAARVYEPDGDE